MAERMMFLDTITYLPDDILVKLDRVSMAVSLEARIPLLDHTLLEFAWTCHIISRFATRRGKWILRQVLYKYVPESLLECPKAGFAIPLDAWLPGPCVTGQRHCYNHASETEGYIDPAPFAKSGVNISPAKETGSI